MTCKYCGHGKFYIAEKGPHKMLYCDGCQKYQENMKQPQNIETGEMSSAPQNDFAYSLLDKFSRTRRHLTKRQATGVISALKGD